MTTRVSSSVLANTAVTPGTYGGSASIPVLTVDQQGRISSAANVSVTIPSPILDNETFITASTSSTVINLNAGNNASVYKVTVANNTSLVFTNSPANTTTIYSFTIITVNDSTAGRALAFANTIKWAGGTLPTRTTAANAVDVWTFFIENNIFYGSLSITNAS